MSHRLAKILCLWAVLCVFGCARQKVDEPAKPVEITLQSDDAPCASVPLKIVDEQSAAKALALLTQRVDLKTSIPEALYSDFFAALKPVNGINPVATDRNGKVVIQRLHIQHFVVAQDGSRLWIAPASEAHDRKLRLGTDSMGGEHALEFLITQPGILRELTTVTMNLIREGKIDQARAVARCTRSKGLQTEVSWEQTAALLAEAEQAVKLKKYDEAGQIAARAEAIIPNQPRTKELLQRIAVEYGGELRSFTGHKGAVTSVAYNLDGNYILSGSEDRTLKLWDAASGKEVRTFTGHRGGVTGVAFSPDGATALSGSSDSTLRLWDVATGRELRATDGLGWKITGVAFSPRGKLVASAADDNQVKLWRLPNVDAAHALAGHGWRVTSVAFSPDGDFSLSGSDDDSVKLWDVAKGVEVRSFYNGSSPVTCVAFSPDSRLGLTGGKDKIVKLWNLDNGREVRRFTGHTGPIRGVAFTRDGRFAVSASDDATVKVWDLTTGKEVRTFAGHAAAVTSVAVSPDAHSIASASADGTVKIWQLPRPLWPHIQEARK